ncbi:MAG: Trp family transcriptional regulator [Patescibacteria group bacterium]
MNKKFVGKNKLPIMPKIGDYNSRVEWENACWRKISASKDTLELLSTSNERHNLVMRVTVVNALASGKSYRQISKELWLSSQTISSIKKALTENNYRSYPERSKKERKKKIYSYRTKTGRSKPRGTPHRTKYGILYMP